MPDSFQYPLVPPAGDLEFSKNRGSFTQSAIDPQAAFPETAGFKHLRLLQVPLYMIVYEVAGEMYQATVSGCTWQIHASRFPEDGGIRIPWTRLIFLAAYLATLVIAGFLAPNIIWRFSMLAVILLAAWALDRTGLGRD